MSRALTLLLLTLALPAFAAPVAVTNGDFEGGLKDWSLIKPEGFTHGAATVETTDVHSGKQAVRMVNDPGGDRALTGLLSQPIALPEGCRTFALNAWMKINVDPQMVELRVAAMDRNLKALVPFDQHGWRFFRPPLEPHRGKWARVRCEFGAQEDWGAFQLTYWVNGPGADLVIDDIEVETIDGLQWQVPSVGRRLADPAPGVALWTESPEVKVYPGATPPQVKGQGLQLSAAGGEYACAQLCLKPERDLPGLQVSFSDLKGPETIPATALRSNFVGLVKVQKALTGRTILGDTPDPLLTDPQLTVAAGQARSIWITLKVPRGTTTGLYSGTVSLSAPGLSASVPLQVQVYGFDLPEQPALRTIARIWQSHPGYEDLFRKNLQEHRCAGTSAIGGIKVSRVEGTDKVAVDLSGLPEAIRSNLRAFNASVFNVPSIFLGDASGFYNKEKKWCGLEVLSPAFDAAFSDYCRQVGEALRAEGVLHYAIWQVWDEPQNDEMMGVVKHLIGLVKGAVPEAKVYMTTGIKPELLDAVGIWCLPWPETANSTLMAQAKAKGAELWAYDNSLYGNDVGDSSLRLRHYLWTLRRHGITGVEWWAISQWKSDPWTVTNQYAPQNGGGFFLYPTPDRKGAPVDSIRWELYREGVEDFDILTLLGQEQDRVVKAIGCTDPRLAGEHQVQDIIDQVVPQLGETNRDASLADRAIEQARARVEFLRMVPGAVVGKVTENGKRVILLATDQQTQLFIAGKLNTAKVASVVLGDKPVEVKFVRGKAVYTVNLEP